MKNVVLTLAVLFSLSGMAGVGGIGGGTSRVVSHEELVQILGESGLEVDIPKVYFETLSMGTYYVSVDALCKNPDSVMASIQIIEPRIAFSSANQEYLKTSLRKGIIGSSGENQPLEFDIRVYRKVSERSRFARQNLKDTYTYKIPDCAGSINLTSVGYQRNL